jgi:hypothetical protein
MRGASTANANTNMIDGEILASKFAHVLVESRREEKITMIAILIGIWRELVLFAQTSESILFTTTRHDLGHISLPVYL